MKAYILSYGKSRNDFDALKRLFSQVELEYIDLNNKPVQALLDNCDFLFYEEPCEEQIAEELFKKDISQLKDRGLLRRTHFIFSDPKYVHKIERLPVGDVFVSPLSMEELALRIKRKMNFDEKTVFRYHINGLSLKQQLILEALDCYRSRGLSKEELLDKIWSGHNVDPKSVDVHIHNIRKSLPKEKCSIKKSGSRWFLMGEI